MESSIRDEVQNIQLSILQDYLELMMSSKYGKRWINKTIEKCEKKKDFSFSYGEIIEIKNSKGSVMITKKSFDVTLLYALIKYDFPEACIPGGDKEGVFLNYIEEIKNNKNQLASHISDLSDVVLINKLVYDSILSIQQFLVYLERLGWGDNNPEREKFLCEYKEKLLTLNNTKQAASSKNSKESTEPSSGESNEESEQYNTSEELYIKGFKIINNENNTSEGIKILKKLEKSNHIESALLLAFFDNYGIYTDRDTEKSKELLTFASFQEDETTWLQKGDKNVHEKRYMFAIPYYVGYSLASGSGDGYYQAGRVFLKNLKNYDLCKTCFRLSLDSNYEDAKKPYEYICKIGKEQYMEI